MTKTDMELIAKLSDLILKEVSIVEAIELVLPDIMSETEFTTELRKFDESYNNIMKIVFAAINSQTN